MRNFRLLLFFVIVAIITSCGSSDMAAKITSKSQDETTTPQEAFTTSVTKVKLEAFNNIDNIRQKLSSIGIGHLGRWRDDEMGGYMSITSYYQFGGENLPNNLAYYLESDNSNSIKTLKLVLNINSRNKKPALSKFAETVEKTYRVLGLAANNEIIKAAKSGQEVKVEKDTHSEKIELEKSRIETWKFIIDTK